MGFVNLYNFQPHSAETALETAFRLNSKIPEIKTLKIVSKAMLFNIKEALELYQGVRS
ncbi:MAG: hypothetical protein HC908_00145 [Calothrix sp. SM1_7_51]|nr:hypothetical protein [Calothrix sp. SM1_7_51]